MPSKKGIRPDIEEQTLRLLSEFEPLTYKDLAEILGLSDYPASRRLQKMAEAGSIHISGYLKHKTSMPCPLYSIGRAKNARRPPKMEASEKHKRYRAKLKKERPEVLKTWINKAWEKRREREQADPAFFEHRRTQKREWARRKFGSIPQSFRSVAVLDEIAMQFGITWRLNKRQERKAA